jgi:undecaprenyl-diphosphatase
VLRQPPLAVSQIQVADFADFADVRPDHVYPLDARSNMLRHAQTIIDRVAEQGWVALLAMLIVVGGVWGFIELADEVREGQTQRFDEWAVRALRDNDNPDNPIGPRWLEEAARDLTGLGGVTVLALVTLAVTGHLLLAGKRHAVVFLIIAVVGGLVLSTVLKHLFDRARPDLVKHLSHVYTSSFPSGHSMLSAVVYLTLGSLLMRLAPKRRLKLFYLGVAMTLTFLVGVSRVYMGVHWPTDVLAGWTAGLVWALICWLAARALQRRGAVEEADDADAGSTE